MITEEISGVTVYGLRRDRHALSLSFMQVLISGQLYPG
ncbi:hypothetical protein ECEC1845_1811 [Escherichia coli EC1845]|uniref:Uncharacterized protein n=1 Tax=Shigella dysenteriae 1617 TaxID=754093 RepID=A0A0A6ZR64_SHIDY|nr:hypothetical protein Asd1617_01736 [Shigella dysenteriae 1617]AWF11843.1 hypothetical protein CSC24_4165 [Escherichia coli]EFZ58026.1 hypothetical protein ECLT68_3039 [Escherichia coli LT-68]EHV61646.1 hypothetical protein ECDEC6B_1745 [Escherichia coli DEC6B]EIN45222.1 hypothetical protein ECFRIK1985_1939 [Escherichia coli FRIK1985]EIN62750.1 hypothetical protein ECPA5_1810 [Escherichia coli PA5]EIN78815.1 hypothetical protein ECPA10_1935 [Escherichia coli PA10]EIO03690.1 hypothetical pr